MRALAGGAIAMVAVASAAYYAGLNQGLDSAVQLPAPGPAESPRAGGPDTPVAPAPGPVRPNPGGIGPNTIADAAEAVIPAVVNIDVFSQLTYAGSSFPDFEFFFNGARVAPSPQAPSRPRYMKNGTGSGLIIRGDGYILTNNHVVRNVDRIRVTLSDRRSFIGKVVGRDPLTDLAVVKVAASGLTTAKMGTSASLRPGDWALAVGSPLGLDHTVTLGIISATGRSVADIASDLGFIQTDAAINPGNSGGPLVNLAGEVIGINTFIRSDAQNIGFAAPIDTARQTADQLIAKGKIERAWVGVRMASLTAEVRRHLDLPPGTDGALVVSVVEGGPADRAGLKVGDVIQTIDGQTVAAVKDVQKLVRDRKVGERILMGLLRRGKRESVSVALAELPADTD